MCRIGLPSGVLKSGPAIQSSVSEHRREKLHTKAIQCAVRMNSPTKKRCNYIYRQCGLKHYKCSRCRHAGDGGTNQTCQHRKRPASCDLGRNHHHCEAERKRYESNSINGSLQSNPVAKADRHNPSHTKSDRAPKLYLETTVCE